MKLFVTIIILFACTPLAAFAEADSTQSKKQTPSAHWRINSRMHSKGIFTYGGWLGSDNPTFDVNLIYERKKWGLFVFKGLDLVDHYTFYNFSLISVFKNIKVTNKVTVTPYVGSFLEQAKDFADKGSDAVCIVITTVRLHPQLTAEHMALFGNLILEPEFRDWVNRFRLTYTRKHLDVVTSLWHNNQVFDNSGYSTAGINIAYSRAKLGKHWLGSAGITGLTSLLTSNEKLNPSRSRIMITLAVSWVH
ncbi:MAG: hypothetical protein ACKOC0_11735 [Cytophagales bacterium]